MALISPLSSAITYFLFHLCLIFFPTSSSSGLLRIDQGGEELDGLTVDLIHRDSPFINPYSTVKTKYDLINEAIRRSINSRARRRLLYYDHRSLSSDHTGVASATSSVMAIDYGEYVMNISIGNPPFSVLAILDTGSDLTWIRCQSCLSCAKQQIRMIPIFNPKGSSSYQPTPCNSTACNSLITHEERMCSKRNTCGYGYRYEEDNSLNVGELGTETITFHKMVKVDKFMFGCTFFDNLISSDSEHHTMGYLGFGNGPLSLIRQTLQLPTFGGRFSYCLVPFEKEIMQHKAGGGGDNDGDLTSFISFGPKAIVSGSGTVSTHLITRKYPDHSFYYATLESISVVVGHGSSKSIHSTMSYPNTSNRKKRPQLENIVIDSGTTVTYLETDSYHKLVSMLKRAIKLELLPDFLIGLCYSTENKIIDQLKKIPHLVFHFAGGADFELTPSNTFMQTNETVICLAVQPTDDKSAVGWQAVLGSWSQVNHLIGFDLNTRTVSFKPTKCSEHKKKLV